MTIRRVVVDHVLLVVRDLKASRRFYRAVVAPLGIVELKVEADGVAFGAEGMDDFAVFAGHQPTSGAHVAFGAPSREAVDTFYLRGGVGARRPPPGRAGGLGAVLRALLRRLRLGSRWQQHRGGLS
jgi:catechol 2,3-dioxygenase-like lactoylglutathione lyase family enzyme